MKTTGIKQTIDGIIAFELFFAKRARRLLEINKKLEYDVKFSKIIYDDYKNFENIIGVKFVEDTFHEPEYYYQDITLEELSYTDKEFDDYINNIIESKKEQANELKKKQKKEKLKKEEEKLQRKIKQFEKLKLELGK